ncbi:MAG: molybdenum cofactor cytidylyltransferase [Myxococcota bacterium]|jgi:molybdenum cofactor cytidylyltransferase
MRPLGVILAAGASSRMGSHKALLLVGGVPLIVRHVHALGPDVRIGLGAEADRIAAVLPPGVDIVINDGWADTGPRETLQRLIEGLPGERWLIITPVDVPPAPPAVLDALLKAGPPAVPVWQGQRGHPVLLTVAAARAALVHGTLRDALADAREVPVDWADTTRNLNTPEDWQAWTGAALTRA